MTAVDWESFYKLNTRVASMYKQEVKFNCGALTEIAGEDIPCPICGEVRSGAPSCGGCFRYCDVTSLTGCGGCAYLCRIIDNSSQYCMLGSHGPRVRHNCPHYAPLATGEEKAHEWIERRTMELGGEPVNDFNSEQLKCETTETRRCRAQARKEWLERVEPRELQHQPGYVPQTKPNQNVSKEDALLMKKIIMERHANTDFKDFREVACFNRWMKDIGLHLAEARR